MDSIFFVKNVGRRFYRYKQSKSKWPLTKSAFTPTVPFYPMVSLILIFLNAHAAKFKQRTIHRFLLIMFTVVCFLCMAVIACCNPLKPVTLVDMYVTIR